MLTGRASNPLGPALQMGRQIVGDLRTGGVNGQAVEVDDDPGRLDPDFVVIRGRDETKVVTGATPTKSPAPSDLLPKAFNVHAK